MTRHTADPVLAVAYMDEGCRYWRSCLSCPLPACVDDWPDPEEGFIAMRDAVLAELYDRGYSVDTLARWFGLSRRGVYHALTRAREGRAA